MLGKCRRNPGEKHWRILKDLAQTCKDPQGPSKVPQGSCKDRRGHCKDPPGPCKDPRGPIRLPPLSLASSRGCSFAIMKACQEQTNSDLRY